jgi:2-polyprenyl-3-methyl-5-hydroxy-6-metoxy-1,4-benzoquinol methylase
MLARSDIDAGYGVKGVDFSSHGIKKWHPDLETNLVVGDYELVLRDELRRGERYDVVTIANVIEHVLDPRTLVDIARTLLTESGDLVVVAPNDFSPLQELLLQEGIIDEPFWIAHPDHLSYFNKETMIAFLSDAGMNVRAIVADNPVDLNLLNEQMNYVREPKRGKSVHRFRVAVDLFLAGVDLDGLLNVYGALGAMGVGRDLTYYCVHADGAPAR